MATLQELIESEIADFFAGFGSPGEPETPEDMQSQLLARIAPLLASMEQEPVAWRYRYVKQGVTEPGGEPWVGDWKYMPTKEDCNDRPSYEIQALYAAPQLPQPAVPDESAQHPIICRSDERLMETPDITGETVKLIGSFNDDGFCHKHPMKAMRVHPLMQTASYPPQPVMYCPECEPRVAEWAERDKKLRNGKGV
ncbi:Uncharacterised protein [Enterobacter hormaechei]|nr:Uncharacterised protein [Enterobacter hormaechei]VAC58901.1 Uncharacterised protein [Enterobacter hormaechei]VAG11634.1 Uncharacterised protein [Enterobacter hormaechei]DAL65918.1 MAG TPA_asm: hypothetical protein [Caudoviricetes sp.]